MRRVSFTLAAAAAEQLGGAEAIGRVVRSDTDMAMAVDMGFTVDAIDALRKRGGTDREIGDLIIKPRTLSHRRANRSKLTVEESDRAARVALTDTWPSRLRPHGGFDDFRLKWAPSWWICTAESAFLL